MATTPDITACIALHNAGRIDDAIRCYRRALPQDRGGVQVNRLLALALFAKGEARDALKHAQAALARAPADAALLNDAGNILRALGRRAEAAQAFRRAIAADPALAHAPFNLADCLLELGRHQDALAAYEAIAARGLPGMDADFHVNHGTCLVELGRTEDALAAFRRALAADPAHAGAAVRLGAALQAEGRHREAVEALRDTARRHGATVPLLLALGQGLVALRDMVPALEVFDEVLRRDPANARALVGRGLALSPLRRHAEAIAALERAVAIDPGLRAAHLAAGNVHLAVKEEAAAIAAYARAAALPPGREPDTARALLLFTRMRACDWTDFDATRAAVLAAAAEGSERLPPFEALAIADDPALHLRCAARHARDTLPALRAVVPARPGGGRIRIGYVSGELRVHAVGLLMARLLECHDRDAFELHALSIGRATGDAAQARIRAAVDGFHDVAALSDAALVDRARGLGLDIAVDLNGYSGEFRTAAFAQGIAPVQVLFLGYPGTSGAPFMDYAIADCVTVPSGAEADWAERIIRLPHAVLPGDDQREIALGLTRARFGLPEHGFVFCCFNNTYKITPDVFGIWMRLLAAVPGSVLWLREEAAVATANLRAAAAARGIDPARLVMAARVDHADHLGRHALADLFLDTLPYNAHTTALDALGAGLPVLTLAGRAFAGRVAASLLSALGLPDLIVDTAEAYESEALALARDPARLAAIRARLAAALPGSPAFDTPRFARNLERAFSAMHERRLAGHPPEAFDLDDPDPS